MTEEPTFDKCTLYEKHLQFFFIFNLNMSPTTWSRFIIQFHLEEIIRLTHSLFFVFFLLLILWMMNIFFFLWFCSFHFSGKLFGVPNIGLIFCIVLPIIFAHIKSISYNSSCIRTNIGLDFRLFLLWKSGNSYCRSIGCLLHHNTHTKSTNRTTVSVHEIF